MENISVSVDSSKTEEANKFFCVDSAEEAVDAALDIVVGLFRQRLLLEEIRANQFTPEHRRSIIIEYQQSDTDSG